MKWACGASGCPVRRPVTATATRNDGGTSHRRPVQDGRHAGHRWSVDTASTTSPATATTTTAEVERTPAPSPTNHVLIHHCHPNNLSISLQSSLFVCTLSPPPLQPPPYDHHHHHHHHPLLTSYPCQADFIGNRSYVHVHPFPLLLLLLSALHILGDTTSSFRFTPFILHALYFILRTMCFRVFLYMGYTTWRKLSPWQTIMKDTHSWLWSRWILK